MAAVFFLSASRCRRAASRLPATVDRDLHAAPFRGAFHVHTQPLRRRADRTDRRRGRARRAEVRRLHRSRRRHARARSAALSPGVLCLDGVEISTNGGHYVALDMPPSPYPLGGEAAASSKTCAGSAGSASRRIRIRRSRELAWRDWTAPIDGIEWLNADTEWRDESRPAARPGRSSTTRGVRARRLPLCWIRPFTTLERWDKLVDPASCRRSRGARCTRRDWPGSGGGRRPAFSRGWHPVLRGQLPNLQYQSDTRSPPLERQPPMRANSSMRSGTAGSSPSSTRLRLQDSQKIPGLQWPGCSWWGRSSELNAAPVFPNISMPPGGLLLRRRQRLGRRACN